MKSLPAHQGPSGGVSRRWIWIGAGEEMRVLLLIRDWYGGKNPWTAHVV